LKIVQSNRSPGSDAENTTSGLDRVRARCLINP
jgi:hypothetical protein